MLNGLYGKIKQLTVISLEILLFTSSGNVNETKHRRRRDKRVVFYFLFSGQASVVVVVLCRVETREWKEKSRRDLRRGGRSSS